jgi:hypothetical protein
LQQSGRYNDLAASLRQFDKAEIKMPLYREVVASFLKRVEALTDDQQKAMVDISLVGGQMMLSFTEIGGSAQDSYVVTEASQPVDVPPVKLEAHRVAKALEHATEMVFDYAAQHNLLLRGPKEFVFGIVGRPNA